MSNTELTVINPFTEEPAFTLPVLAAADVDAVVMRARRAHEDSYNFV